MNIPYVKIPAAKPIFSLGGVKHRFRPIVDIGICGPGNSRLFLKANLDSGADDTLLPVGMALRLGIPLSNAPRHKAMAVGGGIVSYRFAEVELQLTTDGNELFIWNAIVGFTDSRKKVGLLGQTGMLQYFDVTFFGERREVSITPNSSFRGEWVYLHLPRR
jgi:hypothetical protein